MNLKRLFPQFLSMVLIFGPLACSTKKKETTNSQETMSQTYQNPLPVEFGDPYVLDDGDQNYYMYGTGGGAKDGFATYYSNDLVNWEYKGQVYQGNTDDSWGIEAFWAPEVYKKNDKYYMFFSAQWRNNPNNDLEIFKIGVAVADKPTGPFKDLKNEPLFDPGYPIIDANVFQDEDGKYYLYYSRACYVHSVESEIADWAKEKSLYDEIEESWVYGIELAPDFMSTIGEPVLLLRPPVKMDDQQAEWESRSVTSQEVNRRWTEGSTTFKYNGTYYITYSANHFAGENYAVGYATGNSPLGPFTKADNNPILQKNTPNGGDVTGTGHNSIIFSPDSSQLYIMYHGRTTQSGTQRVVFLDKMTIEENGMLTVDGPTTAPQPIPFAKKN